MAVSGTVAIVGAPNAAGGGAAYVYERPKNSSGADKWTLKATLTGGDNNVWFGKSVAVSDFSEFADVSKGTPGAAAVVGDSGRDKAYVYQREVPGEPDWGLVKTLTAQQDPPEGYHFGASVAISGQTAVVGIAGALLYADHDERKPAIDTFKYNEPVPGNWGHYGKVFPEPLRESPSQFGESVAHCDGIIIAGAYGAHGGKGAIYIFESGVKIDPVTGILHGEWVKRDWARHEIEAPNKQDFMFGKSVAVGHNFAVASTSSGAAYVFEREKKNKWKIAATLVVDNDDNFGSVAFNTKTDTAFVGGTEAVYPFGRYSGGPNNWGEKQTLTAYDGTNGDWFGSSVATSGNTTIVGAPSADAADEDGKTIKDAGAVYVFYDKGPGVDNRSAVSGDSAFLGAANAVQEPSTTGNACGATDAAAADTDTDAAPPGSLPDSGGGGGPSDGSGSVMLAAVAGAMAVVGAGALWLAYQRRRVG